MDPAHPRLKFAPPHPIWFPVNQFIERASQLLDAAEAASARSEACSGMTVLIGHDGAIRLIAQSLDWPLASLALAAISHGGSSKKPPDLA